MISRFTDFCSIDLRLGEVSIKSHRQQIKRFIRTVDKPVFEVTSEDIRDYLRLFVGKSPITYAHVLGSIKVFYRDFLGMEYLVKGFKFPEIPVKPKNGLPNRDQLKRFYEALPCLREKALFLMYATSGLRCSEVLELTMTDIDFEIRMVRPDKKYRGGKTKHSWLSFYNSECEQVLKEYLKTRGDDSDRVFHVSRHRVETIFQEAREKIGIRITPQILREWFCSEMGRLGVQDRYVDAFCGRIPKSVLARHYTDFSPERLKEIYDKANLTVFF